MKVHVLADPEISSNVMSFTARWKPEHTDADLLSYSALGNTPFWPLLGSVSLPQLAKPEHCPPWSLVAFGIQSDDFASRTWCPSCRISMSSTPSYLCLPAPTLALSAGGTFWMDGVHLGEILQRHWRYRCGTIAAKNYKFVATWSTVTIEKNPSKIFI